MATKDLTATTFDETTSEGIVLVDFWAEWCGPCKRFAPIYQKVSERHSDILFAKVDTEAEPVLARDYEIMSIPTLLAVRDGVILYRHSGLMPESALESLIAQVRAIDMEDVRSRLEAA